MRPQKNWTVLQSIKKANRGEVTPDLVLSAAASPKHPWHNRIEWDDAVCGRRYRIAQARMLIRTVEYEHHTETRVQRSVCYVRDPDLPADRQGYVAVADLRSNTNRARATLLAEFERIAAGLRRARALATVLGLESEVAGMLIEAEGFGEVLRELQGGAVATLAAA